MSNITGTVSAPSEDIDNLMNSLDLADTIPVESESTMIGLLLGNDYYLDKVLPQKIEVQNGLNFLN